MVSTLAIADTITNFQALHDRLGLQRATDTDFFPEWQHLAINLSEHDYVFLDQLRQRYHYYYNGGLLTEGTILLAIVAPLLNHFGFHEPPCCVRSESPIGLALPDRDEIACGRIDILVVQEQLWILTVEAKRSRFAVDIALPQCLAYMTAAAVNPSFGLVTNGSDFVFCKLVETIYDFSEPFSLLSHRNRLHEVATLLINLKDMIVNPSHTHQH
ncbi:type I restriction endonuclease subunit R [Trichothermofontia sp.]